MSGQHGTKELQEAVKGVFALYRAIKAVTADGAQLADLAALFAKYQSDAEFKAVLDAAYADISNAQVEMQEFDWLDGVDLLKVVLEELKK